MAAFWPYFPRILIFSEAEGYNPHIFRGLSHAISDLSGDCRVKVFLVFLHCVRKKASPAWFQVSEGQRFQWFGRQSRCEARLGQDGPHHGDLGFLVL